MTQKEYIINKISLELANAKNAYLGLQFDNEELKKTILKELER